MTNNRFCIDRNGDIIENVVLCNDNKETMFEDLMNMDFEQMTNYEHMEDFVVSSMDAVNEIYGGADEDTYVTLVDKDGVLIWSVIMGPGENEGDVKYNFVDWRKDGKTFKYADANEKI